MLFNKIVSHVQKKNMLHKLLDLICFSIKVLEKTIQTSLNSKVFFSGTPLAIYVYLQMLLKFQLNRKRLSKIG